MLHVGKMDVWDVYQQKHFCIFIKKDLELKNKKARRFFFKLQEWPLFYVREPASSPKPQSGYSRSWSGPLWLRLLFKINRYLDSSI